MKHGLHDLCLRSARLRVWSKSRIGSVEEFSGLILVDKQKYSILR